MCCPGRRQPVTMRILPSGATVYSNGTSQSAVLNDFPKLTDAVPILVTDEVIFRLARVTRITRLLPILNEVRVLEDIVRANQCKTCKKPVEVDRTIINTAKAALAECSDETAKLVKQAAGVLKFKVVYRRLTEPLQEVIR